MNTRTRQKLEAKLTEAKDNLAYWKDLQRGATVASWESRDGDSSRRVQNYSVSEIAKQVNHYQSIVEKLEARLDGEGAGAFYLGAKW